MMKCCVCQENSRRLEICAQCAPVLWPHRIVNRGAKRLSMTLLAVAPPPARVST